MCFDVSRPDARSRDRLTNSRRRGVHLTYHRQSDFTLQLPRTPAARASLPRSFQVLSRHMPDPSTSLELLFIGVTVDIAILKLCINGGFLHIKLSHLLFKAFNPGFYWLT